MHSNSNNSKLRHLQGLQTRIRWLLVGTSLRKRSTHNKLGDYAEKLCTLFEGGSFSLKAAHWVSIRLRSRSIDQPPRMRASVVCSTSKVMVWSRWKEARIGNQSAIPGSTLEELINSGFKLLPYARLQLARVTPNCIGI